MALAQLACGTVLTFATHNICPAPGERAPCHRHGYCSVESVAAGVASGGAGHRRRRRPRDVKELIDYLRLHRAASTDRLRREGFTLRTVYDAARSGALRLREDDQVLVAALVPVSNEADTR